MNFIDIGSLMEGYHHRTPDVLKARSKSTERSPLTPGQIATEIEKNGCYGFDDYGRFIEPGSEQITVGALKAVAGTHKAFLDFDFEDADLAPNIDQLFMYDTSIRQYGWLEGKLPEFESPAPAVTQRLVSKGPRLSTQTFLLDGLIQLANENTDCNLSLKWLFETAGFSDLNREGEFNRLNKALQDKAQYKIKKSTLHSLLVRLGLLDEV